MSHGSDRPVRPSIPRHGFRLMPLLAGGGLIIVVLFLAVLWFVVRQEVDANEILVLVNKTGRPIPTDLADEFGDQVVLYPALVRAIAERTGESAEQVRSRYKGIRHEVLGEGRYFFNPYSYKRIVMPATLIGQNEVGIQIRRFGKPLPFPKTVATQDDERGPVDKRLQPGRHNINLLAYEIQKFPAIQIPEGHVGVVTLLSGADPVTKNTYTV